MTHVDVVLDVDAGASFPSSPASNRLRREKVPWGWTPSTEWHCVRLVLICAAESDSTLCGLLATYRRSVGLQHRGSTMTCRCFMTSISVPDCRRQRAPFLDLYRRTRHVGVLNWSSTIWVPINVVLHDHARKPVDLQPWTSYARVKHDRKSSKNSEAVTGNLWKVNVSVSWLFGNFFFASNPGQFAVHQVYKFVTSLFRSDRIVEYSFVR